MSPLGRFLGGLRSLLRKNREEQELNEELQDYLDASIERKVAAGLSREDARRAARTELGSTESIKEEVRAVGWESMVEAVWRDVRHGIRLLGRSPRFTIAATITLALGIGATTAIFSVVSAVLWQPLAYPNAARMVNIVENVPAEESMSGRAMRLPSMSPEEFRWWRSNVRSLSDMAVIAAESRKVVTSEGTITLDGASVSPSLFAMRGVPPIVGRWFYPDNEPPGANVVILSADTWQRYYGADRSIVNRTIALDGRPYTVVGVMPAAFGSQAFWTPYVEQSQPGMMQLLLAVFLLRDGVSLEDAAVEVNALGTQLRGSPEPGVPPRFEVVRQIDQAIANVRPALQMLAVAVVVVLLIVCANVANLLMVRGASRRREIGIRQSLGAARGRIVRQLLTEGLLLSLMGGIVGVLLAFVGVELLRAASVIEIPAHFRFALGTLGPTILPHADQVTVDSSVLAFALAISLATGLVFALVPALRLSRAGSRDGIGTSQLTSRGASSGRGAMHTGNVLAVMQIGLATTLLIGSGLLLRSFMHLSSVYTGFDPDAQIFHLTSPPQYSRSRKLELAYDLSARLQSLPGVEAAGLINLPPLSPVSLFRNLYLPDSMESQRDSLEDADRTTVRGVSSEYLQALGVRLLEGRWLAENDRPGQPQVMLVNRAWVERFSPNQSPVGTTASFLTTGRVRRYERWEIVGVVDNVRWRMNAPSGMVDPDAEMPFLGFMDLRQFAGLRLAVDTGQPNMELDELIGEPGASYALRTPGGRLTAEDLRAMTRELDPGLGVDGISTMGAVFSGIIGRQRFYAVIVGLFGGIAALIAAVGIYGVLAYAMTQRTQEFGIRLALGAQRGQVLSLALRQGAVITAIGIPAGIAGALGLTRYLETMLFGITSLDVRTYIAVVAVFTLVALFAAYIPARRATKVDPLVALRCE